jgi:hypothetical protein
LGGCRAKNKTNKKEQREETRNDKMGGANKMKIQGKRKKEIQDESKGRVA